MSKSQSNGNGGSYANAPLSPYWAQRLQGWDIRPVTHWDFTQGRDPA